MTRRDHTPAAPQWRLPSRNTRIAGAVLAVITLLFAAGTAAGALDDGLPAAEVALRAIVAGVLLVIAAVVGALSLAPAFVRRVLTR
jgi:hypothetical protein